MPLKPDALAPTTNKFDREDCRPSRVAKREAFREGSVPNRSSHYAAKSDEFRWRIGLRLTNLDSLGTEERPCWQVAWISTGPPKEPDQPPAPSTAAAGARPRPGAGVIRTG